MDCADNREREGGVKRTAETPPDEQESRKAEGRSQQGLETAAITGCVFSPMRKSAKAGREAHDRSVRRARGQRDGSGEDVLANSAGVLDFLTVDIFKKNLDGRGRKRCAGSAPSIPAQEKTPCPPLRG